MLGIHVPRRHRLQSRLAESARLPHAASLANGETRKSELFDVEGYEHAVRLWTVVLEISVLMAQFPSREIAQRSYDFRTLGLGYANVGGLLMSSGIPYDSDAGRAICGALSAIMTGVCLRHLGRNGGRARRRSRAMPKNRERDAAGDPQSSPRRLRRTHRLRADDDAAGAARPRGLPRPATTRSSTPSAPGTARSRSARRTAIAMRRRPWWRRPAPSAW